MRNSFSSLILILALVTLTAACGNTDDDSTDGDAADGDGEAADGDEGQDPDGDSNDTDGDNSIAQPALVGRVSVFAYSWGGVDNGDATVGMEFYSGPMKMDAFSAYAPGLHRVVARGGDCVLYAATAAACDPLCDWDKYCDAENTCQTAPVRQSAGTVTLTAGTKQLTVEPSDDIMGAGFYYPDPLDSDLVSPDTTFAVAVEGADFPAFELETTGVESVSFNEIDAQDNTLLLQDGQDNEITWEPLTSGGIVQVIINSGWHGAPPEAVLYCEAPASQGSLVISQNVVEAFPSLGGPALMGHGSYIGVTRYVRAEVAGGEVELAIGQRSGLNAMHNAEGGW